MKYLIRYWLYHFYERRHGLALLHLIKLVAKSVVIVFVLPRSLFTTIDVYIAVGDFKSLFRFLFFLIKIRIPLLERYDPFFSFSEKLTANEAEALYSLVLKKSVTIQREIILSCLAQTVLIAQLEPGEMKVLSDDDLAFEKAYQVHRDQAVELLQARLSRSFESSLTKPDLVKPIPLWVKRYLDRKQSENLKTYLSFLSFAQRRGVTLFPVAGTLLGLVREGGLLTHDIDMDAGVFYDEEQVGLLLSDIEKSDQFYIKAVHYQVFRREEGAVAMYAKDEWPVLIKLGTVAGMHIDLFVFYKTDNLFHQRSSMHLWVYEPFELESTELKGQHVFLPKDAGRFLTQTYGDWQVEKRAFSYHTDTPHMRCSGSTLSEFYYLQLAYALSCKSPQTSKKILEGFRR